MAKSKSMCAGCRDNFYNGNNNLGVQECWNYESAKVISKKRWGCGMCHRGTISLW